MKLIIELEVNERQIDHNKFADVLSSTMRWASGAQHITPRELAKDEKYMRTLLGVASEIADVISRSKGHCLSYPSVPHKED